MTERRRYTGIDALGDVPWGTHFCLFYETRQDLIDLLVPYFKEGLENNEFCMWITSEPLEAEDAKNALQKVVTNLSDYLDKGQIEILDYAEWYTKSGAFEADRVLQGWLAKEREAVNRGFDGLRLTGNTFWLEEENWSAFEQYEAAIDGVIHQHRILALCTYSVKRCGLAEVVDVVHNHQFALIRREGKWRVFESAERKRAEEELRESEERFRTATETLPIAMVITRQEDGAILYANRQYCETIGVNIGELIGRTAMEFYDQPGDRDRMLSLLSSGEKVKDFEIKARRADGTCFWAKVSADTLCFDGQRSVVTVFQDITESLHLQEERERLLTQSEDLAGALRSERDLLETVMECTEAQIAYLDRDFNFVRVNSAYEEGCGYPKEQLIGHNHFELFPHEENQASFERVRDTGEPAEYRAKPFIFPARPELGTTYWDWTLTPVFGPGDEIQGLVLSLVDVTERIRSMMDLDEERARLRAIIDTAPLPIVVTDDKCRVLMANSVADRIFRLPVPQGEVWTDQTLLKRCYPDGTPYEPRQLPLSRSALDGEVCRDEEMTVLQLDGERQVILVNSAPILDAKGTITGAVGVFQDITERRRTRDALRRYAQRLRLLHDVDQFILASPPLDHVMRATLVRLRPMTPCLRASVTLFHPESSEWEIVAADTAGDTGLPAGRRGPLTRVWFLKEIERGEVHVTDNLQELTDLPPWAEVLQSEGIRSYVSVPLIAQGELNGSLNLGLESSGAPTEEQLEIWREVASQLALAVRQHRLREQVEQHAEELERMVEQRTEQLRASEAQFRAIFEGTAIGVALVDLNGRVMESNPALQHMLGYSADELRGLPFSRFGLPSESANYVGRYEDFVASDEHHAASERRFIRSDGEERWAHITLSLVRSATGEPLYSILVVEDITEEKEAHEALIKAEKLAVTGRLAASLAHEVNNPLQAVIGCLGLAKESLAEGGNIEQYLDVGLEELRRAADVVARLRDIQRTSEPSHSKPIDLRVLLEKTETLTRKRCEEKGTHVTFDCQQELPLVKADDGRIQQVFLNLILNAVDAMEGKGELCVTARETRGPRGVSVDFTDTGTGIDPDVMRHIFDPFVTTKEDGLGLGLYVSRNIVEDYGGRIEAQSLPGRGTTFSVWLPC